VAATPMNPTPRKPLHRRSADGRLHTLTTLSSILIVTVGIAVVFVLLIWVLPDTPDVNESRLALPNLIGAAVYVSIVAPALSTRMLRRQHAARSWLRDDRAPTEAELRVLLRAPLGIALSMASGWIFAALLFGVANSLASIDHGLRVALTVTLAGFVTAGLSYLLTERLLRPIATLAMSLTMLDEPVLPGVTARILVTWGLVCGAPLAGLLTLGITALIEDTASVQSLSTSILVLAGIALFVGMFALVLATRATAGPIRSVRRAMANIARGNLDTTLRVTDASELGLLQSGFNAMATGLREREHMRDVFGRHVGADVAQRALRGDLELGGETRQAAALFVDLVGSTQLASARPPQEVVRFLNQFFTIVVEVIDAHGGWVNKFEGDAALAVFGAPRSLPDAADRALAASRDLDRRLREAFPHAAAGIGVAYGTVVAGNIGSEARLEYTVIGDAVNIAARLTELAKHHVPMVLTTTETVAFASLDEQSSWRELEQVTLRGRSTTSQLAGPI
jgi:adenylate cyclase